MTRRENRVWSPKWLEHSGLPQLLTQKCRGVHGWLLFKKIVELDCERNSAPGTVEISLQELERLSGLPSDKTRKAAIPLRKLKTLAFFLPDNDEEAALFRVVTPLHTPVSPEEIRRAEPHLFSESGEYFRYHDDCEALSPEEDDLPSNDPDLKTVVDLYFDVVGLRMNAFILDELRMLPQKFTMDEIRSAFSRARKNEIHSLRWVIQDLVRRRKKTEAEPPSAQTPLFTGNDNDSIKF